MDVYTVVKATEAVRKIEKIIDTPEEAAKGLKRLWNTILYSGKIKYGTIYITDKRGINWKVKVGWRGDLKNYVKIMRFPEETEKFRAAVGKKHIEKPWKYKELALEEWKILAVRASSEKDLKSLNLDAEMMSLCIEILNELVYERKLQVEQQP